MYDYIGLSLITHFVYNSIEYLFHKIGHYKHNYNYIYKLHIIHHKKYYPVHSLQSDTYRHNNEGSIAYIPPFSILIYLFYHGLPFTYFIFFSIQIGITIFINNYIHKNVHLKETWLDKYEWFLEIRHLHLTHHKKLYSNYSFGYDYTIDKLANTYLET